MQIGNIFIVDLDTDDRDMIKDIAAELKLPNVLKFFSSGRELIDHLAKTTEPPFIILCEVNLPTLDGFDLRKHLLVSANKKFHSVPFIFFSNKASNAQIQKAYDLSAHGFFLKPATYREMVSSFKVMIQYWQISCMPEKVTF